MLKLCLVSFPYTSSRHTGRGLDRYTCELYENLRARCSDVAVRLVDEGSTRSAVDAGTKLLRFVKDLLAERSDVYHAIMPISGAVVALLGRRPLVVTVHDVIPFNVSGEYDSSLKYRFWRQCIRTCVRKSAALIVPYQVTKDEIVQRLQGDPSKIYVIHHGVDHSIYYPRSELVRAKRRIVYLGEVSRSKGVDLLIRAFAIVKASVPDAELVISGKRSKDEQMLHELSRSLNVRDLTFRGYIPEEELPHYYGTATAMVFPSRCGFGLSTLEAMACGTPVVALAALDAPEFIGDAGLLARVDDPEDLARQLLRAITDEALQAELVAKGIARAQRFSWANMAEETAQVYADALAAHTNRSGVMHAESRASATS